MFKKAVEAKSHQRLSGADRKKLRRTVRNRLPLLTDELLDTILPPKVEITLSKFQNRVIVYSIEGGCPMFFDIDGRGTEIFPTVFALWEAPEMLPSFMLKGGEVSRYIIGGADLMFPGILIPPQGYPSFSAGEIWAVKVPGNLAPIAVGCTTMSSEEALKAGLRGKALRITHYYRDFLWESAEGHHVPNAGFMEDVVMEDPAYIAPGSGEDILDTSASTGNEEDESALETASTSVADATNDAEEHVVGSMNELNLVDDVCATETNTDKQITLSPEEVDALLDQCLLQALHTTLKEKDLPIPGSTLWANHVLPCRPSGLTLDIKKSSLKKLSKWLQSKASGGMISVKEDKHKKEIVLISVNRSHPDYKSFKPEKKKAEVSESPGERSTSQAQSEKGLEIIEVYKPSIHNSAIFASVGEDKGNLYTASEATDVVFKYIEKENLVKPTNKSMVVLDPILCDALFKGAIKKGSAYPSEIHKKDVGSTFVGRMQPNHVVMRGGGEPVVRKGAVKPVQIMTERRQGNKKVTKVTGMETFLIDPDSFGSELQKKFACSTSVGELPGKKGYEVLIQGGVIDNLARYMVEHYGVPKRYIEVLDKTRK
ncbi:putative SUI1 domain, PUA domain, PUA-like superfamily, SUI1 domain superfamily, Pre-PUA protein [Arabidopsis thaliana]|nr:SUI1 domain [Arabidopsis thaliana x Arabidopsis arenosa]KAG7659203.1 SWIB/MDM2 domain superfamily [Arabidopsis suecica]